LRSDAFLFLENLLKPVSRDDHEACLLPLLLNRVLFDRLLDFGHVVHRRVLLSNPRVRQNLISVQPLRRVDYQQLFDQILGLVRDLIPVRRRELKISPLDHIEQLCVVVVVERREAAKPVIS